MAPPTGDSWGEDDNPRRYDAFTRDYPIYRETSRDLVAVALPSADAAGADVAVLDLACGTGATTREILAVLGPGGRVTGVDKSAAMLRVAARSITDFLGDGDGDQSADRYPALLAEMRAIAERDYGRAPDEQAPGRRPLTRESIWRSLVAAGLEVELVTEVSHQDSAESQRAWLSIPIFTRDRLRGLPYQDRMRLLDEAYERLGPGRIQTARWAVFVARRPG